MRTRSHMVAVSCFTLSAKIVWVKWNFSPGEMKRIAASMKNHTVPERTSLNYEKRKNTEFFTDAKSFHSPNTFFCSKFDVLTSLSPTHFLQLVNFSTSDNFRLVARANFPGEPENDITGRWANTYVTLNLCLHSMIYLCRRTVARR